MSFQFFIVLFGLVEAAMVTNSYGSVLSSNAVLTVLPADEIPATYSFQVGGVDGPLDVAQDSSNNLYVTDEYNDRVEKLYHSPIIFGIYSCFSFAVMRGLGHG